MKIMLINIRYGYVGGPERYLFNLKDLLEKNQHKVIPFSIKYSFNESSKYDAYFASPLSDDESVYYKNQSWNVRSFLKTVERNFYSSEVEEKLSALIQDTKPNFAIVLLYLRKLSPAVLVALDKMKVPFVVRLSDYGMLCPGHNFFRGKEICELCVSGSLINSVRHKCVHDSYGASLVNYMATKYHSSRKYFDLIRHFVVPSRFLIKKMVEAGWESKRFHHLPTFANTDQADGVTERKYQVLYAGRLEYIKGVHVLLASLKILKEKHGLRLVLKLAGNGNDQYIASLREFCHVNNLSEVQFVGNLDKAGLFKEYQESYVSVIPSLCYDNLPNSALESLSVGTPVIAPAHGSFLELIADGKNGLLFDYGNADSLALKIKIVLDNPLLLRELSLGAIASIRSNYSAQRHYDNLMSIIEDVRRLHKF